jgi:hypothetical protein
VRVAGSRQKIEDGFAAGKELAGLDEHQVWCWTSWHRWTILAMLAHAFLSVLTARRSDDGHADVARLYEAPTLAEYLQPVAAPPN